MISALRVRLFGSLEVEGVAPAELGSRKQRTLLRLLAAGRGRPVAHDVVVDRLWPGRQPGRPADQVSVLVSRLRGVLGTDRVARSDAGYALRADWIDLVGLEELLQEAERFLAAGLAAAAATAANAGLALARGALLADEPDAEWAEAERRSAERNLSRLRLIAAEATLLTGDPFRAAIAAQDALADEPYDEQALRVLMTAHARAGRPAQALAAYAKTREDLVEGLGSSPSPATEELYLAILRDEIEPFGGLGSGPGPPGPVRSGLPGRAQAWAALNQSLTDAETELVIACVEGEAGMGKTHLLGEWAAAQSGVVVLWGTCKPVGQVALQPVLDAIDGALIRLKPSEAEAWLDRAGPVLGPLLSGWQGHPAAADPLTGQSALFASAANLLAGTAPAVLVLDDVHLADPATQAWLAYMGARAGALAGVLVVVARQPGGRRPWPNSRSIVLDPLDLSATAEVVGRERAADLHARSGGNPLYLVQLAAVDDPTIVPSGIVEAVTARAASLGSAHETLVTAAALGMEVDLDVLAGVLQKPAVAILRELEQGQQAAILEERGTGFAFRHDLIRRALAESASSARRALAHRDAARILAGRPVRDPLVVAGHARLGGDLALSAQAMAEAAEAAQRRYDYGQAEDFLSQALQLDPSPVWNVARGQVRLTREDFAGAMADARTAMSLDEGIASVELACWAAYYQRDFDTARRLCAVAAASGGAERVAALAGRIAHADGDLETAAAGLEAATSGVAAVWLGWLLTDEGEAEEAARLAASERHDPSLGTHPFAQAHRGLLEAYAAGMRGQTAEALACLGAVDQEVERRHLEHFRGRTLNYRAWLLRNLLEFSEADALNQQAVEVTAGAGLHEAAAQAQLDLADAAMRAGRLDDAEVALRRYRQHGTGYAFAWKADVRDRLLQARLDLDAGRPEMALTGLRGRPGGPWTPRHAAFAAALEARAQAAAGRRPDQLEVQETIEALGRFAAPEAWWVIGELARDLGFDTWWDTAARYVAALAAGAGALGPEFTVRAATVLDRMRSERRRR